MKDKKEIVRRAVCLLCFADRCSLEDNIFDGIRRSLAEREKQRKIIIYWLKEKDYFEYLTSREKEILCLSVTQNTNTNVLIRHNDFECIEPMLWSVGLTDKLSDYDDFVFDNLHIPLEIGPKHTLGNLLEKCHNPDADIIKKYREISMLWYWRCIEARKSISKKIDFAKAIRDIFGNEYLVYLDHYEYFDFEKCDFIVRGKCVRELNLNELAKLETISERRFYSFEWLSTNDDWEEVDLVC